MQSKSIKGGARVTLRLRELLGACLCMWLCLAACLPVHAAGEAPPDFPLGAPAVLQAASAPARELAGLAVEFESQLPAQRRLSWRDPRTQEPREWSPRLQSFSRACLAAQAECAPLLNAQLRYLQSALRGAAGQGARLRTAIAWSLLTELCGTARDPALQAPHPDSFMLCGGQAGTAAQAALAWWELGYEELFVAYLDRYEDNRRTTIAWLAARPLQDATARQQRERLEAMGSHVASAQRLEISDHLDLAADHWLAFLIDTARRPDASRDLAAPMLHLSRLAYRMNNPARGDLWRQAAEALIADLPALRDSPSCLIRQQRALIDIARRAAGRPGVSVAAPAGASQTQDPAMLRQLLEARCGFSEFAMEASLQHLAAGRYGAADTLIEAALRACEEPDRCSPSRMHTLRDLRRVTRGDTAAIDDLASQLREEAGLGPLAAAQRRTLVALARALGERDGRRAQALAALDVLDADLHAVRSLVVTAGKGTLANLERYEEWSRWHVRLSAEQGVLLDFELTESLRGQSLLRRLRLKRWEAELAGVRDTQARAALQAKLEELESARKALGEVPQASQAARAMTEALRETLDDNEVLLRQAYLGELARRRARPGQDRSGEKAWLRLFDAPLLFHEYRARIGRVSHASLGADEAYLSWLAVPGGYVATLAVPAQPAPGTAGPHRLLSRYVPVSTNLAATLTLYRRLLEAGAGAAREPARAGARADEGLELENLTVWRLPDGSFTASLEQPSGAARAQSLAEISDGLYRLLLEPFSAELAQAARLTISPDRELATLPFETLTRNGEPLLHRLPISYVQSLAVHEELSGRAARRQPARPGLLTLADPDYTPPPAALAPTTNTTADPLRTLQWEALPGTREESAGIARLFPGASQWLGRQASRARLDAAQRSGALAGYRVLHFATHGYVDDERSALVLAMGEGAQRAYLLDTDVAGLTLDADLVLLSACNTGIGRNVSGEGVMGLPYAFLLAGNSNTLMSLWQVDDQGTAAFMVSFMTKARAGVDLPAALVQTKREFARGAHGAAFADPRVWGAFVQYGVPLRLAQ